MIKILHLYDDLMNLYGEYGNVEVLNKHLLDQGLKVKVERKSVGDRFKFTDYDFVYCGCGLESNQKVALKDIMKHQKDFNEALESGTYMLFTGNSMELLGEKIDEEEALNVAPLYTNHTNKRYSGDVVCSSKDFGEVVGFINKDTMNVELERDGLFKYVFKDPALDDGSIVDGYRVNNVIGTHIIGPILAKNPKLLDYLVRNLGTQNLKAYRYKKITYPYEEKSFEVTLNALKGRIEK